MLKITTRNNSLHFGDGFSLDFQRTLRIPDDGSAYPLPPGLGAFPVCKVADYKERVPPDWIEHGGVFIPMYQREALWINFHSRHWKPNAVKVAVGKVNAVSGKTWNQKLLKETEDYMVCPPQPWLDGINAGEGFIRQFVAMPLGMGYTIEAQVTGEERFGGIQLKVFEPKAGRFREPPPVAYRTRAGVCSEGFELGAPPPPACAAPAGGAMGLGAGGRMEQKIYPDPHGIDTWDRSGTSRVFVHIVNTELWREITGERPPETPVTAKEYARHGLPWFSLYDESAPAHSGTKTLRKLKSIRELDAERSDRPLQDDEPVEPGPVRKLWMQVVGGVRDGKW